MAPRRRRREQEEEEVPQTFSERVLARIQSYLSRANHEPVWVDQAVLVNTGILEEVTHMLNQSGWPRLLTLTCEADMEDTAEFLGTFTYVNTDDNPCIVYSHRGVERQITLRQLRRVFRWPEGGAIWEEARGSTYADIWSTLSTVPYKGGETKAKGLTEPVMFYLHHIFSKTVFAKKNADKVGHLELAVLFLVRTGRVVNWAHYFCQFLHGLRSNSPICCGGMITYLVRQLHSRPILEEHHILHNSYADYIWFRCGQNIQTTHDGVVQWCHSSEPELNPPPVAPRGRGRPRGARAAREMVIVERGESSQSQQQQEQPQYQSPDDYARAHIDHMFHMMRSTFMYGQQITMVPAPPGWYPGQPIPPEYMQPHPPGY